MTEYGYHVDENDNVIGKITRKEANEKKNRIRASRIIIFNNKNEILIQKRSSTKSKYPNHWDFGVAETLIYGESYEAAAIRGLKEELGIVGISNRDIKLLFKLKYTGKTKRWYTVYFLIYEGVVKIDKDEVSEAKFVSENTLNKMLKTEKFMPAGLEVYKEYKKINKIK